jgi:hypothetical protein
MFSRIGVMRALSRHVDRVFNPARKGFMAYRRKKRTALLSARSTAALQRDRLRAVFLFGGSRINPQRRHQA